MGKHVKNKIVNVSTTVTISFEEVMRLKSEMSG
jgi:hypothetical protein